jgi:hypothetical protein
MAEKRCPWPSNGIVIPRAGSRNAKSLGVTSGNLRSTSYPRNTTSSSRNRIQSISMYDYNTGSITYFCNK